jgi:hypothetical protein
MALAVDRNPVVPTGISKEVNNVEKHIFKDETITNLYKVSLEQLMPVFEAINKYYFESQRSNKPPAGCQLFINMYSPTRPVEFVLELIGERKPDQLMKKPALPAKPENCDFCKLQPMTKYSTTDLGDVKVILSREHNPLPVPVNHYGHFFEMQIKNQIEQVLMAIRVLKLETNEEASRVTLITHVGAGEGHQTFGHSHTHILASLGRKQISEGKQG